MKRLLRWTGTLILLLACLAAGAGLALAEDQVIKITAKKFEFTPGEITLKKGAPVVLEITSADRLHGFNCPDLGLRADISPGQPTRLHVTPTKAGTFVFRCDIFCGEGHEDMSGSLVVKE
jgi:cytochrome c oxidase subunit 2